MLKILTRELEHNSLTWEKKLSDKCNYPNLEEDVNIDKKIFCYINGPKVRAVVAFMFCLKYCLFPRLL